MIIRYGYEFPDTFTDLAIELFCFRVKRREDQGGLGTAGHFTNVVDILWNHSKSPKRFDWHPWAEKMRDRACDHKYLSIAGCASSGKTDFGAVWAIVNYLSDPLNTSVLVTSTTLKDSRKRIWGSVRDYWTAVPGLPGKLLDSYGEIKPTGPNGKPVTGKTGISLLSAERKREKEAIGKMIGFKSQRVVVIADELPELSEAVLEAAFSNLSNNPEFQLIGLGNPASYYDAFGVLSEPRHGWASINASMDEWETTSGFCVRFDAERSPNVLAQDDSLYPWMIGPAKLAEAQKKYSKDSKHYWRMYRGFWCPTGGDDGIYSETDVVKHRADQPAIWKNPPTPVAALDPSFSSGGDRTILYFGWYGENADGLPTLCYDHYEVLSEDVTSEEPRSYQIVRQLREACEANNVLPQNVAYDSTGAGAPFGDVVDKEWSSRVMRVHFGGKASDRPVSATDPTPSHDRYANRVTELWFSAKEFLATNQIKGIPRALTQEMCARTYTTEKGAHTRLRAEPKADMKMRTGESPDIADAAFILLELCRERLGMSPDRSFKQSRATKWKERVEKYHQVFEALPSLVP